MIIFKCCEMDLLVFGKEFLEVIKQIIGFPGCYGTLRTRNNTNRKSKTISAKNV